MKDRSIKLKVIFCFLFFVFIFSFLFFRLSVQVAWASLAYVSDLISTSGPSLDSSHTIQFTVSSAVPSSGKIIIKLEGSGGGSFDIPALFDYTDVDFSVATSGSPTDRQVAATPSATEDGISVVSGTSGSVTITLNSTDGINAGATVKIELGEVATFEETGDVNITNPAPIGSYRIRIETKDQSDVLIEKGTAMIAVVGQVATTTMYPLELSNGLPSGTVAGGNSIIEISLNTNKNATCRYATTSGISYSSMTGQFSTTGSTLHTVVLTGFQDSASYSFYVLCTDTHGYTSPEEYVISFSLGATPTSGGGGGGPSPTPQYGSIPGGSQKLYLSSVVLEGQSYYGSKVVVLKDGEKDSVVTAKSDGSFESTISRLERGTYTFSLYASDSKGRQSATYSSTLTVEQGTANRISGIVIPPTIEFENDTVEVGEKVTVFGESVPKGDVEMFVKRQTGRLSVGGAERFIASSTGLWEISFGTDSFKEGTYEVKVRTIIPGEAESNFSRTLFLGVGGPPEPDFSLRADLNKDGKVNLIDFSILLVYWNTSDANADINSDGLVNLGDFSIMLFYWTG